MAANPDKRLVCLDKQGKCVFCSKLVHQHEAHYLLLGHEVNGERIPLSFVIESLRHRPNSKSCLPRVEMLEVKNEWWY